MYKVDIKKVLDSSFNLRIDFLKRFMDEFILYSKNEQNTLENKALSVIMEMSREEKNNHLMGEEKGLLEEVTDKYIDYRYIKNEHLLLLTVALNSEIEIFMKYLVGWTKKISNKKYMRWTIREFNVFFETLEIPIDNNEDINIIRKINNRYKHNGAICDVFLQEKGFGAIDSKIVVNEYQLNQFFESARDFLKYLIEMTPVTDDLQT